ncbi:MAG: cytochrome c-type biogenesis protein CcmH [Candidatus Binataceae bacterium]
MRYAIAPWMALLLALILAGGASVVAAPAKTSVQEVGEGLTCQCGCGLTVANCNHPSCGFAVPTRGEIAGMINRGMSRLQILQSFRHKYGEKVLSAPTTEGFNLLAWVTPYVAVAGGMLLIVIAAARWRRPGDASGAGAHPAPATVEFDANLRHQLERDLRRQI